MKKRKIGKTSYYNILNVQDKIIIQMSVVVYIGDTKL
jgi:hypothetical protein